MDELDFVDSFTFQQDFLTNQTINEEADSHTYNHQEEIDENDIDLDEEKDINVESLQNFFNAKIQSKTSKQLLNENNENEDEDEDYESESDQEEEKEAEIMKSQKELDTFFSKQKRTKTVRVNYFFSSKSELDFHQQKILQDATEAFLQKNYTVATQHLKTLLHAQPSAYEPYLQLAMIKEDTSEFEDALVLYMMAAYLKQDVDLWQKVGEISMSMEMFTEAEYCLDKQIQMLKGQLKYLKEKKKDVKEILEKLLDLHEQKFQLQEYLEQNTQKTRMKCILILAELSPFTEKVISEMRYLMSQFLQQKQFIKGILFYFNVFIILQSQQKKPSIATEQAIFRNHLNLLVEFILAYIKELTYQINYDSILTAHSNIPNIFTVDLEKKKTEISFLSYFSLYFLLLSMETTDFELPDLEQLKFLQPKMRLFHFMQTILTSFQRSGQKSLHQLWLKREDYKKYVDIYMKIGILTLYLTQFPYQPASPGVENEDQVLLSSLMIEERSPDRIENVLENEYIVFLNTKSFQTVHDLFWEWLECLFTLRHFKECFAIYDLFFERQKNGIQLSITEKPLFHLRYLLCFIYSNSDSINETIIENCVTCCNQLLSTKEFSNHFMIQWLKLDLLEMKGEDKKDERMKLLEQKDDSNSIQMFMLLQNGTQSEEAEQRNEPGADLEDGSDDEEEEMEQEQSEQKLKSLCLILQRESDQHLILVSEHWLKLIFIEKVRSYLSKETSLLQPNEVIHIFHDLILFQKDVFMLQSATQWFQLYKSQIEHLSKYNYLLYFLSFGLQWKSQAFYDFIMNLCLEKPNYSPIPKIEYFLYKVWRQYVRVDQFKASNFYYLIKIMTAIGMEKSQMILRNAPFQKLIKRLLQLLPTTEMKSEREKEELGKILQLLRILSKYEKSHKFDVMMDLLFPNTAKTLNLKTANIENQIVYNWTPEEQQSLQLLGSVILLEVSMSRVCPNRNFYILQSLAFITKYKENRPKQEVYYNYARVFLFLGIYGIAFTFLEKALESGGDLKGEILYCMAWVQLQLGHIELAQHYFQSIDI